MLAKVTFIIAATMFINVACFSQTIKENIAKQSKNPKTAEHAARADIYIMGDKKKIIDSMPVPGKNASAILVKKQKAQKKK